MIPTLNFFMWLKIDCLSFVSGENGTTFMQSCQNKRRSSIKTLFAMLAAILVVEASGGIAREVSFYVSTKGNDLWSGRLPDGPRYKGEGPFATLPTALEAARTELTRDPKLNVNILFRDG